MRYYKYIIVFFLTYLFLFLLKTSKVIKNESGLHYLDIQVPSSH